MLWWVSGFLFTQRPSSGRYMWWSTSLSFPFLSSRESLQKGPAPWRLPTTPVEFSEGVGRRLSDRLLVWQLGFFFLHADVKWLAIPHFPHSFPKAGHFSRRMLSSARLPCPGFLHHMQSSERGVPPTAGRPPAVLLAAARPSTRASFLPLL